MRVRLSFVITVIAVHACGAGAKPPPLFQEYCFECHRGEKPKAGLNLEHLLEAPRIGAQAEQWDKIAGMLESAEMPPSDAERLPADPERLAAAAWVRTSLQDY